MRYILLISLQNAKTFSGPLLVSRVGDAGSTECKEKAPKLWLIKTILKSVFT